MKRFKLEVGELLQREKLKAVFGGNVNEGHSDGCAWEPGNGNEGGGGIGLGLDYVQARAGENNSHYCCDQCCNVGWLNWQGKMLLGCAF